MNNENDDMNKQINDTIKKPKNRKKNIIIISCAVAVVLIITVIVLIVKNSKSDKTISDEEFKAIIQSYGDAATLASQTYISTNKGEIPTFDDIRGIIIFDAHEVECATSIVNYDGSIYLSHCKVDNLLMDYDYSYGEYLEEPKTTGDKIYIYERTYGDSKKYYYITKNEQSESLLATYNCYDSNCIGYDYSEATNQFLLYDGAYYLYDFNNNKRRTIDLGDKIYRSIGFVETSNKIYGLSVYSEEGCSFYNYELGKYITSNDAYSGIYSLDSLLENNYILGEKKNASDNNIMDTYLIDLNTGNVEKNFLKMQHFHENINGNTIVYSASDAYDLIGSPNYLFDRDFNLIIETSHGHYSLNSNDTITVLKNKKYEIRDLKNNLIYASREYDEIIAVSDYVVVLDDEKKLKVLDLNENEIAVLSTLKGNYQVHSMISGWYKENKKEGIYVVVENKDIPFGTKGSGLEYYYIPSTGETGVIETEGVGGYAKPVLYLYPTKKTNVTVSFEKAYLLTTTYPKFNNSWNVSANPNGDLYDTKGNYYYGLYWEEEGSTNVDFSTGFYVTKENAIDFLEEKLNVIGLTARERNEFIMYWLPILEKNERNLVYFELTEERDRFNKLIINPTPDSILRVAIHIKKVDNKVQIKEQKLSTFERKGFAAVEWGGVIHY